MSRGPSGPPGAGAGRPAAEPASELRREKLRLWGWLATFGLIVLLFVLAPRPGATSSALSKASDGLWAMRAYLEARDVEVELLDAPLSTEPAPGARQPGARQPGARQPGVLLLALPWQRPPGSDFELALDRHLRAGGDVVLAYGGSETVIQVLVFEALGLAPVIELRDEPPFFPLDWWRYKQQRLVLEPAEAAGRGPRLEIPALDDLPSAPAGARVHFTAAGSPAVFEFKRRSGRVLVAPVALFTNAELARNDHADVLEGLMQRLGGPWRIDEYHHGLVRPELLERSQAAHAWDLFALHLALLYGLAVFAAGRRFGPAWREELTPTGSTNDFLRSLGVLHHQLGHHRDAAHQLLERARRLDANLDLGPPLPDGLDPDAVENGPQLTAFAAELSRHRQASRG